MNKPLMSLALILLLGACTPTPTPVPILPSPISNIPVAASATPVLQNSVPTVSVRPSETPIPSDQSAGTLQLQILSPQDEAVVNTPQVDVIGSAPVGAVVTVNDEILIVGADGRFQTTLSLEEGPNLIEIVASDENGNERSLMLTITYES